MKYPAIILVVLLSLFAVSTYGQNPARAGFDFYGDAGVASVSVGTAGTGYTSPPTVAFTGGGGTGDSATGTSTLKVVGTVTVTAGGTGYTVGDVLTLVGGTKSTTATVTVATISGGGGTGPITAVTITNAGVYTVIPTAPVAVTGGTGTAATFTPGYGVATVVITGAGSGYTSAPTVAFSGGAGSSAAATATLDSGATAANAVSFSEIVPITNSVISAITFPSALNDPGTGPVSSQSYAGSQAIVGKTLTAGIRYQIAGDSVTFSSGTGLLILRPAR